MAAMFAASFIALYVGHMVGDHVVQTDWQAANKAGKNGLGPMSSHLLGYCISQTLALQAVAFLGMPIDGLAALAGITFSVASHGLIDRRWPVRWLLEHTGSSQFATLRDGGLNGMYLADQALHIGCLFVSALTIAWLSGGST